MWVCDIGCYCGTQLWWVGDRPEFTQRFPLPRYLQTGLLALVRREQFSLGAGGTVWRPVRLAYQPPASSTFLSEQTSHQQPDSSIFLSQQISISHQHQPNEQGANLTTIITLNTRWYPARCCENFLNKILRWDVKVVTPKILHGNIRLWTHYIWKHVILLRVNHSKIVSKNFMVWYTCYKLHKIDLRHKYVIWWMMTWRIVDGDMAHSGWWRGMLACWEKSNHDL
jgi:hypothetical protein